MAITNQHGVDWVVSEWWYRLKENSNFEKYTYFRDHSPFRIIHRLFCCSGPGLTHPQFCSLSLSVSRSVHHRLVQNINQEASYLFINDAIFVVKFLFVLFPLFRFFSDKTVVIHSVICPNSKSQVILFGLLLGFGTLLHLFKSVHVTLSESSGQNALERLGRACLFDDLC